MRLGKKPKFFLLSQNVSNFNQWVENWFWKQEMELSKQEMELFLLFPDNVVGASFPMIHNLFLIIK